MILEPRFITFEGIDNCGKTTQIKKLSEYLTSHKISHQVEREPGSTALGGALRQILKHPGETYSVFNTYFKGHKDFSHLPFNQERTDEAELFLFLAARAEFVAHIVRPALQKGVSVLADRFSDSTEAYQGGGLFRGDPVALQFIQGIHDFILRPDDRPDLTLLLDIPYETMLARAGDEKQDAIEKRGKEYFDRVRNEYHWIAKRNPTRVVLLDGTKPADEVFTKGVLPLVQRLYQLS